MCTSLSRTCVYIYLSHNSRISLFWLCLVCRCIPLAFCVHRASPICVYRYHTCVYLICVQISHMCTVYNSFSLLLFLIFLLLLSCAPVCVCHCFYVSVWPIMYVHLSHITYLNIIHLSLFHLYVYVCMCITFAFLRMCVVYLSLVYVRLSCIPTSNMHTFLCFSH